MSAASTTQLFGRAYRLTVLTQTGDQIILSDSAWEPEALRIVFSVEQMALGIYWSADITIFNLNLATQQFVIQRGDLVTLSAGYQANFNPGSSLIFKGHVFQPLWERENVVDSKLTLRCLVGLFEDDGYFVNLPLAANSTQEEAVYQVAYAAGIPIQYIDYKTLSQKKLPRGKMITGRPTQFFSEIAADNKLQCWLGFKGLNLRSLAPLTDTPDVVFGPPYLFRSAPVPSSSGLTKQTLLGTPQQTQEGVLFSVLLDSQPDIGQLAKLDMASVRLLPQFPGNNLPTLLDRDGLYVIAGITHKGDTRGNDWQTEIRGVTRQWSRIYAGLAPQQVQ